MSKTVHRESVVSAPPPNPEPLSLDTLYQLWDAAVTDLEAAELRRERIARRIVAALDDAGEDIAVVRDRRDPDQAHVLLLEKDVADGFVVHDVRAH